MLGNRALLLECMLFGPESRQSMSDFEGQPRADHPPAELDSLNLVDAWLSRPPVPDSVPFRNHNSGFSVRVDARQSDWLQSVFRFTRPDGSVIFEPRVRSRSRLLELERWVQRLGDPHLARVIGWWRPAHSASVGVEADLVSAPLSTEIWNDRVLAVLRPDWTPRGDCLAADHRAPGPTSKIEVAGRGVTWLGPTWTSPTLSAESTRAEPTATTSGPFADSYEWSFQSGPTRVTRSAVLVRGRSLAILLQTENKVEGPVGEVRWSIPPGVEARPDPTTRALILSGGRGKPVARVIPLGLPEANYPTDRGAFFVDNRDLVLRQTTQGPDRCLAILVTWDKKPPASWRPLTVAEKSAACPPGTAFAARASYRPGQGAILIYRSLGPTELRSVLGHQTRARFLVGSFTPSGDVRPWIKVN